MNEQEWEQEYESLMEIARQHLDPTWEHGEVVVLKTVKGKTYIAQIPDYRDMEVREPQENRCIQQLDDADDTEVFCCLATINGENPEILSWNFRERLMELNARNLDTEAFLWGGGDTVLLKPFHWLLPPEYQIKEK